MNGERILACPSCGNPMRFARAISQAEGVAELQTYDCKECGVAVTEAADQQLASIAASDRTPIIGALLSHVLLFSAPNPQPVPTKYSVEATQILGLLSVSLGRWRKLMASWNAPPLCRRPNRNALYQGRAKAPERTPKHPILKPHAVFAMARTHWSAKGCSLCNTCGITRQ